MITAVVICKQIEQQTGNKMQNIEKAKVVH